ncbi:MAG: phenylalanine--tRNA ligase subunit alpha [Patescibacteria group bacterium]
MSVVIKQDRGSLHPLTQVVTDVVDILAEMGFVVAQGPEIEKEFYNFDALNTPADHPSRDMQDTFWLDPVSLGLLLRTHTSAVQVRYMEKNKPPLKVMAPGRVYRNESTDATHEAQFYQVEGLLIDKEVSLAQLKGVLMEFSHKLFGPDTDIRLRPSYFAFVEPGLEVDVSCFICKGKGCGLCKKTGWIEILGAGLVHPFVLRSGGIDSDKWQGLAFGLGVDRVAMLKYGINDIRELYNGDLRFINQF